ncbi:MAG: hypothetical protein FD170_2278 [Bacteroidetes bacterium]|nr:MAG: hypothetical protein FD170_2278 [Bacteroidota bacterium]
MRMRKVSVKSAFILSLLLLLSIRGFSQSKYEKEFRIKAKNAPAKALTFIDSLTFDSKIKWYKEIGLDHITIEAKAKFNNERHSIEFSENGTFQDAEIEVKPNVLPDSTNSKITGALSQRHKKYKIEKIQIQYTGDRNIVLSFLRGDRNNSEGITINYEVVISTKMDGNYLMLEYLFSERGEFLQSSQIISRRTDTIDY